MSEHTSRRITCTVCNLPRTAAEDGECNVPMPSPQPSDCLMLALEREVVCNKCGYGGPREGHGEDGCPYAPFPIGATEQPTGEAP